MLRARRQSRARVMPVPQKITTAETRALRPAADQAPAPYESMALFQFLRAVSLDRIGVRRSPPAERHRPPPAVSAAGTARIWTPPGLREPPSLRNQTRVQSYIRPVAHGNGHHGASAGPRANRFAATSHGQRSSRPGSVPVDRLPHDVDRSLSPEIHLRFRLLRHRRPGREIDIVVPHRPEQAREFIG